jgi:hypothetical protein
MKFFHGDCEVEGQFPWSYLFPIGRIATELEKAGVQCLAADQPMPAAPGEHEGDFYGAKVVVVVGYKCPVFLTARIALADDVEAVASAKDIKLWVSYTPHFDHDVV